MLYFVRAVLASIGWWPLVLLKREIECKWGRFSGFCFILVLCSQFHVLFYLSRPLPNTFGLVLVLWSFVYILRLENEKQKKTESSLNGKIVIFLLGFATITFRCDVVILAGPVVLMLLLRRRLALNLQLVMWGIICAVSSILLSVFVDSYFWGRLIWPEGEVFFFNTLQNRSHEWGVEPFLWYFYSALPRTMLGSMFLIPFGIVDFSDTERIEKEKEGEKPDLLQEKCGKSTKITSLRNRAKKKNFSSFQQNEMDRKKYSNSNHRLRYGIDYCMLALQSSVFVFVLLYSILPHKELRFILMAVPIFDIAAAVGLSRFICIFFSKKKKHLLYRFISCGAIIVVLLSAAACVIFAAASSKNYPGGEALSALHKIALNGTESKECIRARQAELESMSIICKTRVHIDNAAAISGASRFGELHSHEWRYSKKENLKPESWEDFENFDWLLSEDGHTHQGTGRFKVVGEVYAFNGVDWRKGKIRTKPAIYILKRVYTIN
eukprot:g4821.t1